MYRYVVDEQGMVTARQFADLYALAQAAPGPNALWVTLLGLQAAGWTGAVATTLGALIPATVFSLIASALHAQHADAPLALAIRRGLAPVALGFMLASGVAAPALGRARLAGLHACVRHLRGRHRDAPQPAVADGRRRFGRGRRPLIS